MKKILVVQTMAPVFVSAMKMLEATSRYQVVGWTTHFLYQKKVQKDFPKAVVLNCVPLMRADLDYLCKKLNCPSDVSFLEPQSQNVFAGSRLLVADTVLHRGAGLAAYTHEELTEDVNNYFIIAKTILKHLRPDIVLFEAPPHAMYDLAVEDIARKLNIKILMAYHTHFPGISMFISSYRPFFKHVGLKKSQQFCVNHKRKIIMQGLRKNYKPFYFKPLYVKSEKSFKRTFFCLYQNFCNSAKIIICGKASEFLKKEVPEKTDSSYVKKATKKLKDEQGDSFHYSWNKMRGVTHEIFYRINSTNKIRKDSGDTIFFAPLSLQPECSTLPAAGFMFNQIAYLRLLYFACARYQNISIYIKENPNQFAYLSGPQARSLSFYKELLKMKFKFLCLDTSNEEAINLADCVVVSTGTAGFEAAHNFNKPVLCFAETWYQKHPNVYRVNTYKRLVEYIKLIINKKLNQKRKNILNFKKTLIKESVYFWGNAEAFGEQKFSEFAMAKNLAGAVKVLLHKK